MRIQFNKPLRGDYGRVARHEVKAVGDEPGQVPMKTAKSLVERGLAVEVDAKADIGRKAPARRRASSGGKKPAPQQ